MLDFKPVYSTFYHSPEYTINWDDRSGMYVGKFPGKNIPQIIRKNRNDLISELNQALETYKKYQAELLEEVLAFKVLPSLIDLRPIALKRGISTPAQLFEFLELSRNEWLLNRRL